MNKIKCGLILLLCSTGVSFSANFSKLGGSRLIPDQSNGIEKDGNSGALEAKIDEDVASIQKTGKHIAVFCKSRCSFDSDDTKGECVMDCMREYSNQLEHFFIRKYANQCMERAAEEQFSFKEDAREKIHDILATHQAFSNWEAYPEVRVYAQAKLRAHSRIALQALNEAIREGLE